MSLDTKYRPTRFDEVVGQETHVQVLRQIIKQGSGFHQSYVFCGSHGSGKTTLARILARALLCENPIDGNPCDKCPSCREILETGSSECFTEFDAATNSGKDDIKKLVEAVQYDTFSGKQRIYLLDESHRLSKNALDAMLKPMEDTVPGSGNKRLVCIFCTTEPEKMVGTIFSRCAPAFTIRKVTPQKIGERLAWICDHEKIAYDMDSLVLIAELTEVHIRDAIKTLAGVATLGSINRGNVRSYLRLDAHGTYIMMLSALGRDLPKVLEMADGLTQVVSPSTCYAKLAELSMLAYRVSLGVGKVPSYMNVEHFKKLGAFHGEHLLVFSKMFASRPAHSTNHMLACDLAMLHHQRCGTWTSTRMGLPPMGSPPAPTPKAAPVPSAPPVAPTQVAASKDETPALNSVAAPAAVPDNSGKVDPVVSPEPKERPSGVTPGGIFLDPRAVKKKNGDPAPQQNGLPPMDVSVFRDLLHRRVVELREHGQPHRPAGRADLGNSGAYPFR